VQFLPKLCEGEGSGRHLGSGRCFRTASEGNAVGEAAQRQEALQGRAGVEEDVVEYLADTAATLFEDEGVDPEAAQEELEASFLPLLEEYEVSAEDASALCKLVARAAFPPSKTGTGAPSSTGKGKMEAADSAGGNSNAADGDLLCRVTNLLLMYGGSTMPLLKDTTFELVRGHRYGVVGANGSGKTTLMARLASKDLAGFPDTLRVVHLRHEAFLDGVAATTSAREYARLRCGDSATASALDVARALARVGFDEEFLDKPVVALSGGWQMRLGLACAMVQKASLFLLDEPTNHLDSAGVSWLVSFINNTCVAGETGSTAMIVSHDQSFLDKVCTDVIHFTSNSKLAYHSGNFAAFKAKELGGDDAEAQRLLETTSSPGLGVGPAAIDRMAFPQPEKIGDTVSARKAPVVTLTKATFQYDGAEGPILCGVDAKLTILSKVGIVGKNGCGKSTLLSLLAGRLHPSSIGGVPQGELWWHKGLRLAYIAQHSLVHLGEHLSCTPLEYMQLRFRRGYDEETPQGVKKPQTRKEAERLRTIGAMHGKRGKNVEAIMSRMDPVKDGSNGEPLYEVKWKDLGPADNSFEKMKRLKNLGVENLATEFDEKLWYAWAGAPQRPLTTREIVQHLEPFGLSEEVICQRKIEMLSSGQKSKLAFGAAFWTRPQILCLDEPTNYLDPETVEMLQRAIRNFRGGCAVVTHSEKFVEEVCNEVWEVLDGKVRVRKQDVGTSSLG